MIRVGVDVGGTFTDLVLLNEKTGALTAIKVPSTSGKEQDGFIEGLKSLDTGEAAIEQIVHGTTVATNALLQRKGARVAMLCTEGFRDVIEIGRCMRYSHGSLFDAKFVKPSPLVERSARFDVAERIASDGSILHPLSEIATNKAIDALKSIKPDSIAICLINAYANDAHEAELKRRVSEAFPAAHVCTSVEVHHGYQEFERFATTALNAFLMPPMAKYISSLRETLEDNGFRVPILIMSSSGGALTPKAAGNLPVRTILSGPVGGVTAAINLAEKCNLDNLITYDMGGTSTDVCVVRAGQALATDQVIFGGLPVRGTMLEINTVGAGAGSIADLDEDGSLLVGPESAGAVPGPVCYGAGGSKITVTDANLFLGRLNADKLLGERIKLDREATKNALESMAARMDSMSATALAEGIIRIAVAKMAGAIREISVSRGLDPRRFTLLAYGGAGPMHAAMVAEELGVDHVIVPQLPGNFSAMGLLAADLRWEASDSTFVSLDEKGLTSIRAAIAKLKERLADHLKAESFSLVNLSHEVTIDMHYIGQASSFAVRVRDEQFDLENLRALFLSQYEERYGHSNPGRTISVDNVRVVAVAKGRESGVSPATRSTAGGAVAAHKRAVVFGGRTWECSVFERATLGSGRICKGPAIIEENGSTTVVPPAWTVDVDDDRNIRLSKSKDDVG